MRLSVERLRWGLLASALLLVVVLAVLVGYGRYRAVKTWKRIVAKSGATITHEANGVTWSQAVKGRTIFMLHAAKAVPHGNGQYTLHDALLILYGPDGARADRISGSEFDYDQKSGVARALGEVHIDVEPPKALSAGGTNEGTRNDRNEAGTDADETNSAEAEIESPDRIHIRTSGLVYLRKRGVAATDQPVEISYRGFHGYAVGAEFDSGQSTVHLLKDVRAEGVLHGRPVSLTAAKADLDRNGNIMTLMQPVVRSAGRMGSAETAEVRLRTDGSVEHVHAKGRVALRDKGREIDAPVAEASLNARSLLEHAEFSGGATMQDNDARHSTKAVARSARIFCDENGALRQIVTEGGVSTSMEEHAEGAPVLHRQMSAERAVFTMARGRGSAQLSAVEATGSAWIRGESLEGTARNGTNLKTIEAAADDLRLTMAPDATGRSRPDSLTGVGHTRLEQRLPNGEVENSTAQTLTAHFVATSEGAEGTNGRSQVKIASAEQTGEVTLRNVPATKPGSSPVVSSGHAERAVFEEASHRVTLYGRPQVQRGDTSVSAETIALDQSTGDAVASGGVSASFAGTGDAPVTHATSASAVLHKAAQTIEFRGTDARPARLWQGASQVEGASLLLDRMQDTLAARPGSSEGRVHAVFVAEAGGTSAKPGPKHSAYNEQRERVFGAGGRDAVVRVSSARLDYSGGKRQAVFAGEVRAEGATGEVSAERAVVFLKPADASQAKRSKAQTLGGPMEGALDRIVLSGRVRMEQPGRKGTGEQLLYTASSGEFVLTGSPGRLPRVTDATQGSITGATLMFDSADRTIVVAGEPGSHESRVHTVTKLKP